jgi:hypothetical protein
MAMPDCATQTVANIERDLRATDGVQDVEVRVDDQSARLYWDTWEPNEATRGEVLAGVCRAVAQSVDWRLVTVHDPMEREQHVSNCVTLARTSEPLAVRWDPAHGSPRRTTFRSADALAGYRLREWEWTGCQWRVVGGEPVDGVVVENADEL